MIKIEDLVIVAKFKPVVRISILYLPMALALPLIKTIFVEVLGSDATPLGTSFEEGRHMKNSLHYKGLAIDIRCRYYTANQQSALAVALSKALRALDPHWDVVLEFDKYNSQGKQIKWGHLHIEYDINKVIQC